MWICVCVHPVARILWQTAVHFDRQAFQRCRKSALESTVMNTSCCEQSFRGKKKSIPPHHVHVCRNRLLVAGIARFLAGRFVTPPGGYSLLVPICFRVPLVATSLDEVCSSWDAFSERCPTVPSCHSIFGIRLSPPSLFCLQNPAHMRWRALLIHSSSLSCWRPRASLSFRAIIIYSLPQP